MFRNFNLLKGLRRGWWYFIIDKNTKAGCLFSVERGSSTTVLIFLSHGVSINFFFWTPSLFFFLRLFYWSTRVVSLLILSVFWILWILVTVCIIKFTLSKMLMMCIALDARTEKNLKGCYLESLGMGNRKIFRFEHIEDNKYTLLCKKSIKVFF